jgi:hypothetical protein
MYMDPRFVLESHDPAESGLVTRLVLVRRSVAYATASSDGLGLPAGRQKGGVHNVHTTVPGESVHCDLTRFLAAGQAAGGWSVCARAARRLMCARAMLLAVLSDMQVVRPAKTAFQEPHTRIQQDKTEWEFDWRGRLPRRASRALRDLPWGSVRLNTELAGGSDDSRLFHSTLARGWQVPLSVKVEK